MVLIGLDGQISATNSLARELLATPDGIYIERKILSLPASEEAAGRLVQIERSAGQVPLLAWVTPLVNGVPTPKYRAVTLVDPARRQQIALAALEASFHFTKAEMRLAEQIMNGKSPAESAQALGITIHTVRTYLKRLYHKAGVRTQATLVRKLLQAAQALPY